MNKYELHLGDCLEVMKSIPAGSVDMILTDPPYGMNLTPQRETGKFHGVKIKNDNNLLWVDPFFDECFRVTKTNAGSFFFCSHHCIAQFISGARKAGFEVKNILTWDKKHFGMGGNWRPVTEFIILCVKGRFVTKSNNLSNILTFRKVHHSRAAHPTQKPIDLLCHLIEEPDYDPELILDPFMGSGSTGVACMNTGRRFIGIEMDSGYFQTAQGRIMEASTATTASK